MKVQARTRIDSSDSRSWMIDWLSDQLIDRLNDTRLLSCDVADERERGASSIDHSWRPEVHGIWILPTCNDMSSSTCCIIAILDWYSTWPLLNKKKRSYSGIWMELEGGLLVDAHTNRISVFATRLRTSNTRRIRQPLRILETMGCYFLCVQDGVAPLVSVLRA